MNQVTNVSGETIEVSLKRLKQKVESENTLEEVRRRRAHETPNQRRQRKRKTLWRRQKAHLEEDISSRFQANIGNYLYPTTSTPEATARSNS